MKKSSERSNGDKPEAAGPELRILPMDAILEPELPMRASMQDKPFADLVHSMGQVGLLQPILVLEHGGAFEVVCGHRRFLAARELGWKGMPSLVFKERGIALEAARVHENAMREDVNAAEEAVYYAQLLDKYKLDEDGLCALVKRNPDYIGDRLRLLRGDKLVFQSLRDQKINFGVARELNKIQDEPLRRFYLDSAIRSGCSARVVAQWVSEWKANANGIPAAPASATTSTEAPVAEPYRPECCICGGHLDPWNLTSVMIHKHELGEIKKALENAAKAE